jgi:hypothetical protein
MCPVRETENCDRMTGFRPISRINRQEWSGSSFAVISRPPLRQFQGPVRWGKRIAVDLDSASADGRGSWGPAVTCGAGLGERRHRKCAPPSLFPPKTTAFGQATLKGSAVPASCR